MAKKKKLSCLGIIGIIFAGFIALIIGFFVLDYIAEAIINFMYSREGKNRYSDISLTAFDGDFNVKDLPKEICNFLTKENRKDLKHDFWTASEFSNKTEKLIPEKEYKPDNYNDYAEFLCNYIIKKTKEPKSSIPPTLEETLKLPIGPDSRYLRNTSKLWAHVSVLMDVEGKDKESLIIPFGIYYLSRDFELKYRTGAFVSEKSTTVGANNIADLQVIRWASKPRPATEKISKYLAKDLLELVDKEIQLNRFIEFQIYMTKMYLKRFIENGNTYIKYCCYGDFADNRIKYIYNKVDQIITLPYAENKEKIKELIKECNNELYVSSENLFHRVISLLSRKNAVNVVIELFLGACLYVRENLEVKLAKMEMAAIALAYNSYYSEKQRRPSSMEELEEWFGQKLPVNRFYNEPYKFYEKEGYVLYNNGVNEKYEPRDTGVTYYGDDFYFKFNEN